MKEELNIAIEDWKTMRQLTLDLLEVVPDDKLSFTVGKNMGSIGKQYRHIGDVQICYNEGIKTGKVDFNKYRRDYSLESSKEKLLAFLQEVDAEMIKLIEENAEAEIDWFGDKWSLVQHIRALIGHEILHHGELIVYIRTLGIKFPESWKLWGL